MCLYYIMIVVKIGFKEKTVVSFKKEEQVSKQNIIHNFGDFVDKLKSGIFEKIAVIKNNQTEAIIISPDEYKKLEEI